jgi:hypothetical protein
MMLHYHLEEGVVVPTPAATEKATPASATATAIAAAVTTTNGHVNDAHYSIQHVVKNVKFVILLELPRCPHLLHFMRKVVLLMIMMHQRRVVMMMEK